MTELPTWPLIPLLKTESGSGGADDLGTEHGIHPRPVVLHGLFAIHLVRLLTSRVIVDAHHRGERDEEQAQEKPEHEPGGNEIGVKLLERDSGNHISLA